MVGDINHNRVVFIGKLGELVDGFGQKLAGVGNGVVIDINQAFLRALRKIFCVQIGL